MLQACGLGSSHWWSFPQAIRSAVERVKPPGQNGLQGHHSQNGAGQHPEAGQNGATDHPEAGLKPPGQNGLEGYLSQNGAGQHPEAGLSGTDAGSPLNPEP